MANQKNRVSFDIIQQGIREIEKLLAQKQYNLSMVKARQILEYMVNSLYIAIDDGELELIDKIDKLYKNRIISKTSLENYHKIRQIGNKAIHQNDNNAYSANNAFSLLSNEIVTFSHINFDNKIFKKKNAALNSRHRIIRRYRKNEFDLSRLIVALIPIFLIILIALVYKYNKQKNSVKETLPIQTSTVAENTKANEANIQDSQKNIYITTANLNVRSAPNTDASIVSTLNKDTEIEFIRNHDSEWAVINYNGSYAYVSSKYIKAKSN